MERRSPLAAALRESRAIILGALLVAVGYNLFAGTGIPWIREQKRIGDTLRPDDPLFGSAGTGQPVDTASAAPIDTIPAAVIDTTKLTPKDTLPKVAPVDTQAATPAIPSAPKMVQEPIREATTPIVKRIFDEKRAIFIDARPTDQFEKGHIPGAINIYANDFPNKIPDLLRYSRDTTVVAYCGGGLCELSHELAEQLHIFGFKRVIVYTGGTAEWIEQNYPFTSDENK